MSRVISGETLVSLHRWDAPSVENPGTHPPVTETRRLPTEKELEQLRQHAREEAFAQGLLEGREAGRHEIEAEIGHLQQLMQALARPLEQLDHRVQDELVALAGTIARHLLLRELRTDPAQIMPIVRDALAVLPVGAREVSLVLHPEDAEIVREGLSSGDAAESWKIVEDPRLSRGGCRVMTETSLVDATVETRLATVMARISGHELVEVAGTAGSERLPHAS